MSDLATSQRIKNQARALGFDLVGITSAEPHSDITFFDQWLQKGFAGSMNYLARRPEDRADPRQLLPSAQSMICCGLNYYGGEANSADLVQEGRGWISRYAWGDDYHEVLLDKLNELETFIRTEIDHSAECKAYVDTGPILERSYAARAGLGWIGKNTMLIDTKRGSYFFIGVILTSLELITDTPQLNHCGTCRACLDSCPTEALTPYELDATRCISYLTIEHRGPIAPELKPGIGHHLFGCDICQEVCPWNRDIPHHHEPAFQPRPGLFHPPLDSLADLDEAGFKKRFPKSAMRRTRWDGLKRNHDIVQSNQRPNAASGRR